MNATFDDACVFVVGCPRSGTTLLNSMLMSDPDFAIYEAETLLLDVCGPRYGPLDRDRNFERFLDDWWRSKQFERSGLAREELLDAVAPHRGDLPAVLGAFMRAVARKQQAPRWADSTPSNVFHLRRIAETFPKARVVHMIRDPRAVALSLSRLGWTGVSKDQERMSLIRAAAKWRLSIEAGRRSRSALGDRYLEVRYEDLVDDTPGTLERLNGFLGTSISEQGMAQRRHGALARANSAFEDTGKPATGGLSRDALHRWRDKLTSEQCALIEATAGPVMEELGYPASETREPRRLSERLVRHRMALSSLLRRTTPLGRFSRTGLEIGS